jgi:hypothetical protein
MSAVPSSGDTAQPAPSTPAKKSLKNETWWKIKFILSQIIPETGRALAPDWLEKPFSSERWTIAPADIQYRNAQALAKKKTLGVNHRTILKVVMTGLLLIGGAASLYFTIHGLIGFSVLIAVAILLLQLANKLYFLKDPPASRNPHYLEGEKIELVTRTEGGNPEGAQGERTRTQYEQKKNGASAMQQHPAPSASQLPTIQRQNPGQQVDSSVLKTTDSSAPTSESSAKPKHTEDPATRWFSRGDMSQYIEKLKNKYSHYKPPRDHIYCTIEPVKRSKAGKQNIGMEIVHDIPVAEREGKTILGYPLHIDGNHWALVVVDLTQRTVEYYDSKKDNAKAVEYLGELATRLGCTFSSKNKGEIQPDSYQCGPWVLFCLEMRLKKPTGFSFEKLTSRGKYQRMIGRYRQHVLKAIAQPNPT